MSLDNLLAKYHCAIQGNYDGNYEIAAQNTNVYNVELGEILGIGDVI